ncbi:TPM domain-containing protein [Flavobacterium sediminilitoris]|uniref:TPM domain-containing protein n=1 Tax=Flavobacterium sediminilitoris TaxID=2024526 RepID=A0ABY4HHG1_9FLAO|nr:MULTISPECIES: TPM domain-containing protein [Flavobacterium]UOX32170.1 TPM domain-containing protein [Flavobacterium sediminilitoris]
MSKTEDFLTVSEEQEIVQAIVEAEKDTSGEIRVHIEEHSEKPPLERAQEVFFTLNMQNTKDRNGVLFYVGVADKHFAIIGDEGINKVVDANFWNSTKDIVIDNFKNKNNKDGLVNGIREAGKRLKEFFPYQSDDIDELSNEISKG